MQKMMFTVIASLMLAACGGQAKESAQAESSGPHGPAAPKVKVEFSADSAYSYVERQVAFGPRVPNTDAHRKAGDWLVSELRRHGAAVKEQKMTLTAFYGTKLQARNVFGSFNPQAGERLLLVAHWDCRPWADADPDPEKRTLPVDGSNDGASGVGVLLETARLLGSNSPAMGVDILFVDAEDWGTDGDEDSWALGARHFVENPVVEGYLPLSVIVLDMVGGTDALFPREYFSQQSAPALLSRFYAAAAASGYADMFPDEIGGAVTDDHLQFITALLSADVPKIIIPAIYIIYYRDGFHHAWHTSGDTMDCIDRKTLKAVGQTLINFLFPPEN